MGSHYPSCPGAGLTGPPNFQHPLGQHHQPPSPPPPINNHGQGIGDLQFPSMPRAGPGGLGPGTGGWAHGARRVASAGPLRRNGRPTRGPGRREIPWPFPVARRARPRRCLRPPGPARPGPAAAKRHYYCRARWVLTPPPSNRSTNRYLVFVRPSNQAPLPPHQLSAPSNRHPAPPRSVMGCIPPSCHRKACRDTCPRHTPTPKSRHFEGPAAILSTRRPFWRHDRHLVSTVPQFPRVEEGESLAGAVDTFIPLCAPRRGQKGCLGASLLPAGPFLPSGNPCKGDGCGRRRRRGEAATRTRGTKGGRGPGRVPAGSCQRLGVGWKSHPGGLARRVLGAIGDLPGPGNGVRRGSTHGCRSPPHAHPRGLTVVLCLLDGLGQELVLLHADP